MAGFDYFDSLRLAAAKVAEVLAGKGVAVDRLCFGGEGVALTQKPRIPVDANSNFLGNRAMGDWAESALKDLLVGSRSGFQPMHYGDSNQIAAGDEGFKDYYLGELEATRVFGKRPDLLLYSPESALMGNEFKESSLTETEAFARQAVAAVEVRSSKFKALNTCVFGSRNGKREPKWTAYVRHLPSRWRISLLSIVGWRGFRCLSAIHRFSSIPFSGSTFYRFSR